MRLIAGAMTVMLVVACADDTVPVTQAEGPGAAPNAAAPVASSVPADTILALGLTARQLEDADIIDAAGRELADVERLVTASGGQLTSLIVEIEDSNPDRLVTLPLEGLVVVENGNDRDLRTTMTLEQLQALPAATP